MLFQQTTGKWKIMILIIMLGSAACSTGHKEEKSAYDELMKKVLQIHDEAMLKMQDMHNLKTDLSVKGTTANDSARSMAIEKLDRADEAMMAWMRDFSQKFGAGIAHEQQSVHEHTEVYDTTAYNVEKDHTYHLLQEEKQEVVALQRQIDESIAYAKKVLSAQ